MKSREKRKQKLERLARVAAGHKKDIPKIKPVGSKRERGVVTVSQRERVVKENAVRRSLRNQFRDHMEPLKTRLKKAKAISDAILGKSKETISAEEVNKKLAGGK